MNTLSPELFYTCLVVTAAVVSWCVIDFKRSIQKRKASKNV